ncbi:MAG: 3-hydroxyacyl-ACP dehydratase FabZ [Proteobacteria bacterium]|nr:3-hydroxyacyl-ACP dehydratase FabZ [Pseudomonadota bacterium]MCK4867467.1 3-hydroxyacyl-ACP dehydratase FabZ [Alphaproteobacteria bacterium]
MTDKDYKVDDLDVNEIMKMIPHRYPFLMIDRVVDIVKGESAVGVKAVTVSEPHFQGHFPQRPIMPGVLIVEAMAQTAAVLVVHELGEEAMNKLVYFMSINTARFRKPVVPGDMLRIPVTIKQNRGAVCKFEGKAMVGDTLVAEATFSAMLVDS